MIALTIKKTSTTQLVLILLFFCNTLSAAQKTNYKALEYGFSPIAILTTTTVGKQLFKLYQNAENKPDIIFIALAKVSKTPGFFDNPYYQFAYARITHKLELSRGQPIASENAIKKLLEYGIDHNLQWVIAEAQMWLATFHAKRSENTKGMVLLDKVLISAKEMNYLRLLGRAHNAKAILLSFQDKHYLAQQEYLKAFEIFKNYPGDPYLSKISSNIAVIFTDMELWQKAQEYNNQAIDFYHQTNIKSAQQLASFHINAAYIEKHLTHDDSAAKQKYHLDLALKYAIDSGIIRVLSLVEIELSEYWLNNHNLALSLDFAQKCFKNSQEIQSINSSGECALLEGRVYMALEQYEKAELYLSNSLSLFDKSDSLMSHHNAYEQLFLLHKTQHNFEQALKFKELFHQTKVKYLFNSRNDKINHLEQKYAAQTKQQKIALLSTENQLKSAKLAQQSLREQLWLICLLLALIAFYYLIRRHIKLTSSNTQLHQQSHHDALTGLFNRRYFEEQMNKPRLEDHSKYILAIIDIDFFKKINDIYGHDVGDDVLCHFANILNNAIKHHGFVTRWGGEEFVITFSYNDLIAIKSLLGTIKDTIQNTKIETAKGLLSFTISIGVSEQIEAKSLKNQWSVAIKDADKALYKAKNSGRNHIVYIDGM